MTEEFYSFEETMQELDRIEQELKELIEKGEIRAFWNKNDTKYRMKFRKTEIDRLKKSGSKDFLRSLLILCGFVILIGVILRYFLSS